jgi:hypothetical protein
MIQKFCFNGKLPVDSDQKQQYSSSINKSNLMGRPSMLINCYINWTHMYNSKALFLVVKDHIMHYMIQKLCFNGKLPVDSHQNNSIAAASTNPI